MGLLNTILGHPLTRGLDIDDPKTTELRKEIICSKPFLCKIYRQWYSLISENLPAEDGPVLELSSGAGLETGNHMRRMAAITRLIAEELGLDRQYAEALLLAAPMHDIGKVGIPDRVLLKPGMLDTVEWGIMKTHTTIGYDLLKDSNSEMLKLGAEIARTHHEKWNGQGYPHGTAGEAIPLSGRIVAVSDVFDALVNVRHYKPASALGDAIELLRRERGQHFDPACVNALLRRLDEVMDIQKQYAESAADHVASVRNAAVG